MFYWCACEYFENALAFTSFRLHWKNAFVPLKVMFYEYLIVLHQSILIYLHNDVES